MALTVHFNKEEEINIVELMEMLAQSFGTSHLEAVKTMIIMLHVIFKNLKDGRKALVIVDQSKVQRPLLIVKNY